MKLNLTPDQLLSTTRAVRKRLDLTRPVEREVVEECLALAFQAPNGGNRQNWGWVLVDDPQTKYAMAEIYRKAHHEHVGGIDYSQSRREKPRMWESAEHLEKHLHEVPAMLIPVYEGRPDRGSVFEQTAVWGSLLPAVWSFMLALRSRGMGSTWTSVHLLREREMAELLGIPFDRFVQSGLIPFGYTIGTDFKAADRSLSTSTIHWNRW